MDNSRIRKAADRVTAGAASAMRLLALDTSTEACSAAVWADGRIFARYEVASRDHTSIILPMVDSVLADAGTELEQLDALAFGRGPGSFTGVRIGTGVIQGIALASGLPVVPVSTLAALARHAMRTYGIPRVAAVIDARMSEVYWGAYWRDPDGGLRLIGEERVCSPATVPALDGGGWFGAGSGWHAHAQALREATGLGLGAWWAGCLPHAEDVAELAALAFRRGGAMVVDSVLPVYLRDNVAAKMPCR